MRELDLLNRWLVLQRQAALQHAHGCVLSRDIDVPRLKALAYQAEFCDRVREAVKVLANDPGKFIQEFLQDEHQ